MKNHMDIFVGITLKLYFNLLINIFMILSSYPWTWHIPLSINVIY